MLDDMNGLEKTLNSLKITDTWYVLVTSVITEYIHMQSLL